MEPIPTSPNNRTRIIRPSDALVAPGAEEGRRLSPQEFRDKVWRVQNLYKITTKRREVTFMKFNRVQTSIVDEIKNMRPIRHIDIKSRQQGVSTFFLIWYLDDTIFIPNTFTGILAHKKESLMYLMRIVSFAHSTMPARYRLPLLGDSKQELAFMYNNSRIFASLSIRSTSLHNLHISEVCFCKDEEVEATLGATSEDTNISMESTGNGVGNQGYETYQLAKKGEAQDGMKARFHPWFVQPEYTMPVDPAVLPLTLNAEERRLVTNASQNFGVDISPGQLLWRRDKRRKLRSLFRQEYPETDDDAFLTSGVKFFNFKKIHTLMLEAKQYLKDHPPVEETDNYIMWRKPVKGHEYAAGADPADGGNFACLKILDVTEPAEVFRYYARVGVKTFYRACDTWGRAYNKALLGVEDNNHGHAVLLGLEENMRYPNLFRHEKKTRLADLERNKIKVGSQMRSEKEVKLGWHTDGMSRPLMLDHLKLAIEGDEEDDHENFEPLLAFFDLVLMDEALTFEEVGGKFEAIQGKFDDDIMASAIAVQMFMRLSKRGARTMGVQSSGIYTTGTREAGTI